MAEVNKMRPVIAIATISAMAVGALLGYCASNYNEENSDEEVVEQVELDYSVYTRSKLKSLLEQCSAACDIIFANSQHDPNLKTAQQVRQKIF